MNDSSEDPAGHAVTLEWRDGRDRTITVEPRESVLDAAIREGIRLPFDCRTGSCTTCVGRVLSAEGTEPAAALDHRRSPRALAPEDLEAGYALLCIALARTDCRIEVGPMVHSGLAGGPWGR